MRLGVIILLLIVIPLGVACGSDNSRISWNSEKAPVQSGECRIQFHGEGGASRPYKSTPVIFGQIVNPTAADTVLTVYFMIASSESEAINAVNELTSKFPNFRERQLQARAQVKVGGTGFQKVTRIRVAPDGRFFIRPVNDLQNPGVTWLVLEDTHGQIAGARDVRR